MTFLFQHVKAYTGETIDLCVVSGVCAVRAHEVAIQNIN